MLKIKDNVDLKELEKYGFEYGKDDIGINCYIYEERNGGWSNDEICIYLDTRKIHVYYQDFENDYLQNIINKLIKADMVEKVEE